MSDTIDIAARCEHHADMILRASGSGLRNYTMPSTRKAILSAVIDSWEEACRYGAAKADAFHKKERSALTQHEFLNCLRSLFNIDADQLPELTHEQQMQFIRDPVRFFVRAGDAFQSAIWREVAKRQSKGHAA